jgi:proteasome lid subunit RPN8/RPN11
MERSKDVPLVSWSAPQCPFEIHYLPRVLDDIRLAAVDAFFLAPHGGVEIGGILVGDLERKRLRITGYAPVECEHARGPSFTLSDRDRERLAEVLGRLGTQGRRAVGWYHSHTRSEILFSDADREIHQRFFPEAWQAALVLRPHAFQPTRAGFFFREADGSVHGEASYGEFVLEPLPPRSGEVVDDEAPAPAPSPEAPAIAEPPHPETQGKPGGRRRGILLTMVACLAAILLAYVFWLRVDLQTQTERADRAEKSLTDARSQLKTEQEKHGASTDADW